LLLGLVAVLITDVHGKWTAGSAPALASDARFSSRRCKGAPAMPFPLLQMTSITTSPISSFALVEYWQNTPNIRSSGCRLESGGAENRTVAITQKRSTTLLSSQRHATTNSTAILDLPVSAMRVILF
jgi:hypothetical protein